MKHLNESNISKEINLEMSENSRSQFILFHEKRMKQNKEFYHKIEAIKFQTAEIRSRTKATQLKVEEIRKKLIILMFTKYEQSIEQIANELDIDLKTVRKVVNNHLNSVK